MDHQQMVIGLVMLAGTAVLLAVLTFGKSEPQEFLWAAASGEIGSMFVVRSLLEPGMPQLGVTLFFTIAVVATFVTQMRLRRHSRSQSA